MLSSRIETFAMKPIHFLSLCLLLAFQFSFSQNPGDLDLTFNSSGYRVDTSLHSETPMDVAVMADGRIVVAGVRDDGNQQGFLVRRYLSNGQADSTLGSQGWIQTTENDIFFGSTSMALQTDGKILLMGTETDFNKVVVQRLLINGETDTSFANAGRLLLGYPTGGSKSSEIFVLPNGKIRFSLLLAGAFQSANLSVIQLLSDGTVDPFFSNNGTASMYLPDPIMRINATARHSDGSLAITGVVNLTNDQVVFVAKFDDVGNQDATFGNAGYVYLPANSFDFDAWDIASDQTGNYYLAGYRYNSPLNFEISVRKINSSGQVDSNFGQGGELVIGGTGYDYTASALEVDAAGKLILAGSIADPVEHFLVARILPQGQLDQSFGNGGIVDFDLGQSQSQAFGMALQPNGQLLVTGYTIPAGFGSSTGLARLFMGPPASIGAESGIEVASLFPNPCQSRFSVRFYLRHASRIKYSIQDIHGKLLLERNSSLYLPHGVHDIDIDVSDLPAGIYFLNLRGNDGVTTRKLIRQ